MWSSSCKLQQLVGHARNKRAAAARRAQSVRAGPVWSRVRLTVRAARRPECVCLCACLCPSVRPSVPPSVRVSTCACAPAAREIWFAPRRAANGPTDRHGVAQSRRRAVPRLLCRSGPALRCGFCAAISVPPSNNLRARPGRPRAKAHSFRPAAWEAAQTRQPFRLRSSLARGWAAQWFWRETRWPPAGRQANCCAR